MYLKCNVFGVSVMYKTGSDDNHIECIDLYTEFGCSELINIGGGFVALPDECRNHIARLESLFCRFK